MKTTFKKIICVALIAVMLLCSVPFSASAATYSGKCGTNVSWSLNTSTGMLSITGSGNMADYTYYSHTPWYSYLYYIRSVNIGNNVKTIGDYAFGNCANLSSVTIGSGVTEIGSSAFWNCQKLSSLTIGNSVSSIGYAAFEWCKNLSKVIIPNSVKHIGDYAFFSCDKLKNLTIGNNVTSIGKLAFHGCGLTSLTIPASVSSIHSESFSYCRNLTNITVSSSNKYYSNNGDGVLFNKNQTKLIMYPLGNARTSYTFPESVTSIGDHAFYYGSNLKTLTIPDRITSIGDYAFAASQGLQSVTIGEGITSIGNHTFNFCPKLTELVIGKNVTNIDTYAFGDCNSLESIILPNGLKTIRYGAFNGCDSLKSILIPGSVTSIESGAFGMCDSLEYIHIPSSLKNIEQDILHDTSAYICSTTEDCYAKTYASANGLKFKKCNGHNIAVFSTEKTFTVKTGDKMSLAFGFVNGNELDGEWKKMAITVSDPTVISLSDYKKTDYGYMLDIIGKKEGVTNLTVTDTETGIHTVVTVTVADKYVKTYSFAIDNMPSFYPNNKWENNIQTNIYNLNGLYVNNYSYTKVGDKYKVSFNAYNALYHHAAVDIYDADGNWFSSKKIDKYTEMTSVFDTGEQVYYLFANLEWASYIHPMHTKMTPIEIEIPDGGYFAISNNFAESPGCFFYNTFDILLQGVSAMIDVVTDNVETPAYDFFMDKITENKSTRDQFMELFINSVDKEVRQYTGNIVNGMVETSYAGLSGLLENMFVSLGLDWKHLLSSATGIAISALEKISGPLGWALEACYIIPEGTNKLLQAMDIGWSVDEPYMCVYTDAGEGYINPHGVYVDTNGNTDAETVLQVFRISNDDSVKVILDSDNPLEMHELYNISFVKDDKNVQPNGKVEVYVPIPEGMDSSTSKIYRQEADGSWTVLNAKVEGNYLVFETDHFSLYAVVGNKAEIKIASMPEKLTYNIGENIDLTGLSLELNGKVVTSGFYCDPAVAYEIGTQVITVNYGGVSAEFEITVTAKKPVITTPSTTTVNYGETLVLKVEDVILPAKYTVEWIVDGSGFSKAVSEDGLECRLTSNASGTATVTVRIVDENGEVVLDGDGNEISDSIELKSNAGFFQKLISFFKNLFRMNRVIY